MKKKTILVVDDDYDGREVLVCLLRVEGYDCEGVENGGAALDHLQARRCDLILLDMAMPEMTGAEFLHIYSATGGRVPIIVISGSPHGSLPKTVSAFLMKPVTVFKLLKTIERCLDERT